MENNLKSYLKNLALDQLLNTPVGEKLGQAMETIQVVQNHFYAILEKRGELELTGGKAATIATFAILRQSLKQTIGRTSPVRYQSLRFFRAIRNTAFSSSPYSKDTFVVLLN